MGAAEPHFYLSTALQNIPKSMNTRNDDHEMLVITALAGEVVDDMKVAAEIVSTEMMEVLEGAQ